VAGAKRLKTDVEYATKQQRDLGAIARSYVFAPGPENVWRVIHVSKDAFPVSLIGEAEIRPWHLSVDLEDGVHNRSEVAMIAVEDDGKLPWPAGWGEPVTVIDRMPRGRVAVAEARKEYGP